MCNKTIRRVIINQVRFAVYSGAPSFAMVAAIRAGFNLLKSGETKQACRAIDTSTLSGELS